jgi:hypothetical protein
VFCDNAVPVQLMFAEGCCMQDLGVLCVLLKGGVNPVLLCMQHAACTEHPLVHMTYKYGSWEVLCVLLGGGFRPLLLDAACHTHTLYDTRNVCWFCYM